MIELNWSIEGEQQLSRRFKGIPADLGKLKEPLMRIRFEVLKSVQANYGSRGSLFEGTWAPRKDKKPHPLLQKTGTMRNSFKDNLGPSYVEIFNAADYFKYHQSNQPRTKLPRRVMLKIDQIRKVFIVKEFQRHIHKTVTGK